MTYSAELTPWFPLLLAVAVLVLLAVSIIIFVFRYQRRLFKHQEHLREVRETVQQQLLEAALQAQEKERRRIGRDLHDDIGATLSVVNLHLNQWQEPAGEQGPASQTRGLLNEAIERVRQISRELLPVVLDKFGLAKALESLARSVPATAEIDVRFEVFGEVRRVDARVELILYRVAQELLHNTLKHAAADTITIELTYEPTALRLFFSDDGRGFRYEPNPSQIQFPSEKGGLGLFNLQSRVSLVQGRLYFLSAEGEGTQASVFIPLS